MKRLRFAAALLAAVIFATSALAENPSAETAAAPTAAALERAKKRAWDRPFLLFNALFPGQDRALADRTYRLLDAAKATPCWCNDERGTVPGIKMAQAAVAARRAGAIVLLDYERDPIDLQFKPPAEVSATIELYLSRIADLRRADAALRVGLYANLPVRNFLTPALLDKAATQPKPWVRKSELAKYEPWQANWERANAFLRPLAAAVDYVAPSLYLFTDNPKSNEAYWRGNLAQARRYGKPVYAVVHANYVGSYDGAKARGPIPDEVIRPLIEMIISERLADGVILWGPIDQTASEHARLWVDAIKADRAGLLPAPETPEAPVTRPAASAAGTAD